MLNLKQNTSWRRCRFDPWVSKIPWRKKGQSTPVLLPGKFHGQRGLVVFSPQGLHVELDTTETEQALTGHPDAGRGGGGYWSLKFQDWNVGWKSSASITLTWKSSANLEVLRKPWKMHMTTKAVLFELDLVGKEPFSMDFQVSLTWETSLLFPMPRWHPVFPSSLLPQPPYWWFPPCLKQALLSLRALFLLIVLFEA